MTRKISHVVLISALLVSVCSKMSVADWTSDLTNSIHRMTANINQQVEQFTTRLQTQIQDNLHHSLQSARMEVDRAIKNLPRDANGQIITNSGSTSIIVRSGNGVSKSIVSGLTPEGEPYVRNVEERLEGNILHHNETIYNPKTKSSETIRWTLDLSTPGAKPEIITEEN